MGPPRSMGYSEYSVAPSATSWASGRHASESQRSRSRGETPSRTAPRVKSAPPATTAARRAISERAALDRPPELPERADLRGPHARDLRARGPPHVVPEGVRGAG